MSHAFRDLRMVLFDFKVSAFIRRPREDKQTSTCLAARATCHWLFSHASRLGDLRRQYTLETLYFKGTSADRCFLGMRRPGRPGRLRVQCVTIYAFFRFL